MEEENLSFRLNLEFLEPQVEEENEIEQCKKDNEVEEFNIWFGSSFTLS